MTSGRTLSGNYPGHPKATGMSWLTPATLLVASLALAGCGGGGGSSNPADPVISTTAIDGAVSKGPVVGAQVLLYLAGADGGHTGEPVAGPFTTIADGTWDDEIPEELPRPLVVIATGGSYTDEATGDTVELGSRSLRSYLPADADTVAVTPLTELLVRVTQEQIADSPDTTIENALDAAKNTLNQALAINFDPLTTKPLDINNAGDGDRDQRAYTAILAGLSVLANNLAPTADPFEVVQALIDDMSDGTLDGQKAGEPVPVGDSEDTLPTTTTTDLLIAINTAIDEADDSSAFDDVAVSEDGEGNLVISPRYTLGGTVSGLLGSGLVLQEGALELPIESSGSFTFSGFFDAETSYSVTVLTQPTSPMQTCSVTNGSGEVSEDVTNIVVSCETDTFTVGGTVSGLDAEESLILQNNGTDSLPVTSNGGFVFDTPVQDQAPYNVTILTLPESGQICGVINGIGNINAAAVDDVVVSCDLITVSMDVINGSFSSQGSQVVDGTLVLLIQPEPGYALVEGSVEVVGEGCSGELDGNLYTVTLGSEACTVTAEFEEAPLDGATWGNFNWGEANWQ
ncbi:hypothetical protein Tgr7_3038 [Thioalkalivibrio sulfidiphilus HL-EbGr7]|uniref:Uncharacterized protein n=1 Tax=Thioalkalivibrio sulfidiphilus (strain HL-EbGR7) TaxID=396588 RepID=B8GPW0_THISH|nr:hypothetical protein [Thioalkalivibrio sulfidiphilus]ACL74107.1 hypothetical protein Tgr7_3038 [Thioalkalivibrio sulfidiphilus HL-EbGr7]